jgi:hypothetical protein
MNFENESISVDYITLNLKNGKDNTRKIAQYFNHYHRFNCYSCDQKIGFKSKKPYLDLVNPRYKLEMVVVFNSNPVDGIPLVLRPSSTTLIIALPRKKFSVIIKI